MLGVDGRGCFPNGLSCLQNRFSGRNPGKEMTMTYGKERVYKKVEVIGISPISIEDAIKAALHRAHHSLERVSWFEVEEVRGHVKEDGEVGEYQVVLKVAFNLK
jgi:hypothetical protein